MELERKKSTMPIKDKLMEYLAQRDHSELELRNKLGKTYEPQEIDVALEWARSHNWLAEPENLSEMIAENLHRKYKGIHFINQCLKEKGLPGVENNDEVELEKARYLVKNKSSQKADNNKMIRFLTARGFDSDVIRKVIHGEL